MRILRDDDLLSVYNIQSSHTIHMLIRGGAGGMFGGVLGVSLLLEYQELEEAVRLLALEQLPVEQLWVQVVWTPH